MKTKLFFLLTLLFFTKIGQAQGAGSEEYCVEISSDIFQNCPPGTTFQVCFRYNLCTCTDPSCCQEYQACCTLSATQRSCCTYIPSEATNIKWVISKSVEGFITEGPTVVEKGIYNGSDVSWVNTEIDNCMNVGGSNFTFLNNQHKLFIQ